jgi:hypothetical protein
MMKKKLLTLGASLLMIVALLTPSVAQAVTVDQLQDTINKAFRLCLADSEEYVAGCNIARELNAIKTDAEKLPASRQEAYINERVGDFETKRRAIDASYWIAVTEKKINNSDGSSAVGSDLDGADNCGGVDVSIDVGCSGDGNPIYDYLRAIIIFIGGAIGLAVVVSIIVAGIQYSSSNGNPQSIAKAKDRIVNAVIGLLLYLFLAAIIRYLIPQVFS